MSTTLRFALGFLLVGLIMAVTGVGLYRHYHVRLSDGDIAGQTLPAAVSFKDLDGQTHHFGEWRGHLLLVNFWATWCGPCKKEIPALVAAQKAYAARGFQIVGPAVDDPDAVKQEADLLNIDYPVLLGTQERMVALMKQLGNAPGALPFSLLVSPDGRIIQLHLGEFDPRDLNALIEQHLPN